MITSVEYHLGFEKKNGGNEEFLGNLVSSYFVIYSISQILFFYFNRKMLVYFTDINPNLNYES